MNGNVSIVLIVLFVIHLLDRGNMEKIHISPDGLNSAAVCRAVENDKGGYILAVFPRTRWVLFKNTHYYNDVANAESGDSEHYKHISMIPRYHVHKNNTKVSMALPRLDRANEPFLFIPKNINNKKLVRSKKDKLKFSLTKNYYIFDVDDEYNINDNAKIYFN